ESDDRLGRGNLPWRRRRGDWRRASNGPDWMRRLSLADGGTLELGPTREGRGNEALVPRGNVALQRGFLTLFGRQRLDRTRHEQAEFFDAEPAHDELQARLHLVAAVAELGEDLQDPLDRRKDLFERDELLERFRCEGRRPEPAADHDLEP